MKIYINTQTLERPLTVKQVRSQFPNISFAHPFVPPTPYAEYQQTPAPDYSLITHGCREIDPVEQGGVWVQRWEVFELEPVEVEDNVAAARARLAEGATAKRWEVMTSGISLPNGIRVGTTIDDQNRITSVVANAELAGLTDLDEVDFKAASGWARITIGQIKAIAGAIGQHVQACYTAEHMHHKAIAPLSTPEQVATYDITSGWPEA